MSNVSFVHYLTWLSLISPGVAFDIVNTYGITRHLAVLLCSITFLLLH